MTRMWTTTAYETRELAETVSFFPCEALDYLSGSDRSATGRLGLAGRDKYGVISDLVRDLWASLIRKLERQQLAARLSDP